MTDSDGDDSLQSEEVPTQDFGRVERLYKHDIAPAKTQAASHMQEIGEAYKVIKKECHVQPQSVKTAIKAFEMEEAHEDDFLRGFVGTLNQLHGRTVLTYHSNDLMDRANDLATLDDDEFEAPEDELAAQRNRPSSEAAQAGADARAEEEAAPGTGAAARRAMKKAKQGEEALLH